MPHYRGLLDGAQIPFAGLDQPAKPLPEAAPGDGSPRPGDLNRQGGGKPHHRTGDQYI